MVQVALLIAVEIVLSRFLSIPTPITKISFAFLPIAITAMLFGPLYAGIAAVLADFIGATMFPTAPFFPGFTLTAFLTGLIYGLFLYKRPITFLRVICAVLLIAIALHLGLNTVWIKMITGKAVFAILPARLLQTAIMLPVQVLSIFAVGKQSSRIDALAGGNAT